MPLYVYTIEQTDQWDKVVKTFHSYDVYYLSGYVKAFQIHGDGQPLLFYYEDSEVRGINVVFKRDIGDDENFANKFESDTWFDFITPYGYGGWLIEGEGERDALFFVYEEWCRENHIVSEFVRYHPVLKNWESTESFYDVIPLGNTVSMDLSSPETIWNNFTSKNRNMIRKAIKAGVKIYRGHFPQIYETFREIYNLTMDYDNATEYYYFSNAFYKSVLEDLPNEAQVFWAELNGKVIAASIILCANEYMSYHLSGSLREYRHLAPSNLLLYKVALWGMDNGYTNLHLGGGVGSKEDNLYRFKGAFNRNEVMQFSIGKKVYLKDVYEKLNDMRDLSATTTFFPEYRA